MNQAPSRHRRLALSVHAARVALVVCLLLAIPSPSQQVVIESGTAPKIDLVQTAFSEPITLSAQPDANGLWTVLREDKTSLAKVARTLPMAADVVGYRGPTEALIVFDKQLQIDRARLLTSMDTQEHVDSVIADEVFFDQFRSWPWGGPNGKVNVDAVSGATLTSLALAEGILTRIGGDRPSLVFSNELSDEERAKWFAKDSRTGELIRTGPLSDDIAGYQGPTELVMQVDDANIVRRIEIRKSFDNEPYVDYVRTEAGFWKIFNDKSIDDLASFDPQESGVEGVSGATMTSLAVADTVVAAAKTLQASRAKPASQSGDPLALRPRLSTPDIATVSLLLLMALASWMRWYRHQTFRRIWLLAVFLIVGIWSGNLVSMALVAGWGAEGIAWRLAPGLAAIACVAMASPVITKGNPYCNHLCPHGAIQQLVRPTSTSRRRIKIPKRLQQVLRWVPGITLTLAYVMLVLRPTLDLSSWEPFHAYLFRISSWSTIAIALTTLAFSAFIPMGYCRLGCPTGRLLDYLRLTSKSHQLRFADIVAAVVLALAVVTKWM